MKALINYSKRTYQGGFEFSLTLLTCLLLMIIPSCNLNELEQDSLDMDEIELFSTLALTPSADLYYGPETFTVISAKVPVVETKTFLNPNFDFFDGDFTLMVQNGSSNKTKASSVEIRIDGVIIVDSRDFRKKVNIVSKQISITQTSVLEIKLQGSRGSFIELLIEGTLVRGTVTDNENNIYKTVKIGDQWWMAENLRTTKFTNGTPIPLYVWGGWGSEPAEPPLTPAYCWYNFDESYKQEYGALYNSAVAQDNTCPTGWHVPSWYEWEDLTNYLGGYLVAGGKLKEEGITHWATPNSEATNESGFTALPAGAYYSYGDFYVMGNTGSFWNNGNIPQYDPNRPWEYPYLLGYTLNYDNGYIGGFNGKWYLLPWCSIRCIKDK